MSSWFSVIYRVWSAVDLRAKILYTAALGVFVRVIAAIPLPYANTDAVGEFLENNQSFGLLNVVSGGNLERFSIAAAGISPYITASIIMQLLTMVVPAVEEMKKDGERGRQKMNRITRYLTLPIAALQAVGLIAFFSSDTVIASSLSGGQIFTDLSSWEYIQVVLTMVAASILLMWIGELITENGVGNGISLIIFVGIVSTLPGTVNSVVASIDDYNQIAIWGLLATTLMSIYLVVYFTEARRKIPVTYSKRVRGDKVYGGGNSYIPLRVNTSGVIPIIFAISILSFPSLIANFFTAAKADWVRETAEKVINFYNDQAGPYYLVYFLLVFGFTFFYAYVTFNPTEVAGNLKRQGGFIPGVRPGNQTEEYLTKILNRLTLMGAFFLGFVAALPFFVELATDTVQTVIEGTSLLIMVSVVLETMRQIRSQIAMKDYESFLEK